MLRFSSQPLSFGVVLDVVEVEDEIECSLGFFVPSFECLEEAASCMGHTSGSGPAIRAAH
jgi:hypothetical protein